MAVAEQQHVYTGDILPSYYVARIMGVSQQAIHDRLKRGTIPYVETDKGRRVYAPKFWEWYNTSLRYNAIQKSIRHTEETLGPERDRLFESILKMASDWTPELSSVN